MKPTTLNVDGIDIRRDRKHRTIVLRLLTPRGSYDVPFLPHHAAALGAALSETA